MKLSGAGALDGFRYFITANISVMVMSTSSFSCMSRVRVGWETIAGRWSATEGRRAGFFFFSTDQIGLRGNGQRQLQDLQ